MFALARRSKNQINRTDNCKYLNRQGRTRSLVLIRVTLIYKIKHTIKRLFSVSFLQWVVGNLGFQPF